MELTTNSERTCGGCVFAVRNCGALYCANGKAFKPGAATVWEAARITEATGTCEKWHKAFTPAPPAQKKTTRKKPKAITRTVEPARVAQPALFEVTA